MSAIGNDRTVDPESGTQLVATGGLLSGILAGFVASSCCLLPLAVIFFGIGGALLSPLDALAPYQPYLLGTAGLSTTYGFWRAYRKQKNCASGARCTTPRSRRRSRAILWTGAIVVLVAVVLQAYGPQIASWLR